MCRLPPSEAGSRRPRRPPRQQQAQEDEQAKVEPETGSGWCSYGENDGPGAGCIKPASHDGPHLVTPGDTSELADEDLCDSEFPGDDMHAGQLCDRQRGHDGEHRCKAKVAGTGHWRQMTWTAP